MVVERREQGRKGRYHNLFTFERPLYKFGIFTVDRSEFDTA